MTDLPCWLKGKAIAVAKVLIADGFCYCGEAEEFCVNQHLESVGDWLIGNWHYVIDAITDGALFSKDYNDSEDCDIDKEIERIQQLIAKAELDWDSCINEGQLSLF
ncbi:hypothetical protein H6S82_05505 [Planktothrix sp. FACHB-1355]|uniref:Uncharacterized protein n=1 Tax=Aerosakkonema funiforme FACHB-1375 TaxID=2949571 RepID=A0A926VBQ8_9CYAN|nr:MULTISPECIES: hypothetical protein [Oscillatoriales]MBD2180615.1 hypothetical protein [Aerosakkonema funiforme FACHB-1375]MBD3558312.1 hypothetical protein [Planktothrix sp. FACHB-1355]